MRTRLLALAVASVAILAACGSSSRAEAGGKLRVATTVSPITSIASAIAGDKAEITGIVPEGTNSHTFEPKPSVAKTLSQADVVFMNGLHLEDPSKKLAESNLKKGAQIVELGPQTITPDQYIYDFSFPKEEGKPNPHLWTNPPMAKRYAQVIAATLSQRDPANASAYQANLATFSRKVDELDRAMRTAFATIPADRRKLLTYHDAYAYFGKEYGWQIIGAIQVSDFEDPTPQDVAKLIEQVKAEHVPAIFGSEVFPSPVLAQIGKETGVHYVDSLRDDDLPGKPGDPEHSWLGLMRFDFATMTKAMGGDASALDALSVTSSVPDKAYYPQ